MARPLVSQGDRVRKGEVIATGDVQPPIHAPSSGIVKSIAPYHQPHPSGLTDLCILIDTDGEDASVLLENIVDYRNQSAEELRRLIHQAGIVGLGGAAFSTAAKLESGLAHSVDTLILNGVECEPYLTCDDALLRQFPRAVLEGAKILMQILSSKNCLIAIKADMPEAHTALECVRSIEGYDTIQLVSVPARYPAGSEKQLIQILTGREVPSRGIPPDIGVICFNVGTAAAIHDAIVLGQPLISRIVTVTGPGVKQPQNLLARIGTPIVDLIEQSGGYTELAERLVVGGPMMGFALSSDAIPIVKSTNGILVAGKSQCTPETPPKPCIRCGFCAEVCPVQLLPQQLYWYSHSDQWQRSLDYHLLDCIECGCCDRVCPSHITLTQHFRSAKQTALSHQQERAKADLARQRFEARQARLEREQHERIVHMQRKKENLGGGKALEIQQALERVKAKRTVKKPPGESEVS
jgi:electron transport complex protein RnfC